MSERKSLGRKIHNEIKKTEKKLIDMKYDLSRFYNCAFRLILLDTDSFSEALEQIEHEAFYAKLVRDTKELEEKARIKKEAHT